MKPESISYKQWLKFNLYFSIEHFFGKQKPNSYLEKKRVQLFTDILENDSINERGRLFPSSEYEYTSFDEFKKQNDNILDKIAVFRGVAKDWSCTKNWSKEFFSERYSNTEISLIDNPGLVDSNQKNEFKKTDFKNYFEEVKKDKNKYLRFSRIIDNNPELLDDLNVEWLRKFKSGWCMGEQSFLFMGEDGTKTPMHAGLTHTLFIQVKGKKKWTICAPNERIFLNPPADRFLYFRTNANPSNLEDQKFPLLKHTKRYEFVLNEGDVLWMPSLFWHYIENLTPNIGVAFKYTNLLQSFKISKALLFFFFLATKPTILKSFVYNSKNKQDYVFAKESEK